MQHFYLSVLSFQKKTKTPLQQSETSIYNPPGSLEVVGCEVWRAAAGYRPMTEQAFAVGPLKRTSPDVPAAHSRL